MRGNLKEKPKRWLTAEGCEGLTEATEDGLRKGSRRTGNLPSLEKETRKPQMARFLS